MDESAPGTNDVQWARRLGQPLAAGWVGYPTSQQSTGLEPSHLGPRSRHGRVVNRQLRQPVSRVRLLLVDNARMDQRVSLITLGVADTGRARRFYEDLGWAGESPDGDVVFFQTGCMIVALWGRDKLAADSMVDDGGGWGGVTLAYNVNSSTEVDEVLAKASDAGARIGRLGAETFWGGYSGVFIDPDGHPWEVAHNPGWVLAQNGSVHLHSDDS
jgi:uncharacterized protein